MYLNLSWTWATCQMIGPKIEALAEKLVNVLYLNIDVDQAGDAADNYYVDSLPTFILFRKKRKVATITGPWPCYEKLKEAIVDNILTFGSLESENRPELMRKRSYTTQMSR